MSKYPVSVNAKPVYPNRAEETVEFELSQDSVIEQLLNFSHASPLTANSHDRQKCEQPVATPKRLKMCRCHCGVCRPCLEDARWDKIFKEKFADPSYYTDRAPRFSSPLSGI